jgi:hypothetical protein
MNLSGEAAASLQEAPLFSAALKETYSRWEEETRVLLVTPAQAFLRIYPIRQSLEAMQKFDQEFAADSRSRSRLDLRFQNLLAKAALDLCEPWRIRQRGAGHDEWNRWNQRCAAYQKEAAELLVEYDRWARGTVESPARALKPRADRKRTDRYSTWWRRHRAIVDRFYIEISLRDLTMACFAATQDYAENARNERNEILSWNDRTLAWIRAGADPAAGTPEEMIHLVSPEERLRTWARPIQHECHNRLPEKVELLIALGGLRGRSAKPRDVFLAAFAAHAQNPMRLVTENYWNRSAAILREIARAREVIDYWREASPADSGQQPTLFADARHNAGAMLEEQNRNSRGLEQSGVDELESSLLNTLSVWEHDGSASIEAGLFGWAGLLQRPQGRRFLSRTIVALARRKAREGARRTGLWVSDRVDRALESTGGKIPARPVLQPVIRRSTLADTLALPALRIGSLPPMYRLLFRIAPVEDPRFLVGRNKELAGLEQAVRDWESGRFAACLVVGARGSGKTSLLNCAAKEIFAGHDLVRGQFEDRLLRGEEIDAFVRRLLGIEADVDLETALAGARRILVLEESERTYLRKPGGFDAARYLIHLIHRTASTTLWVIGLNDKALRVLDAGAQFRRGFSHRFNAASVSREDTEKAILERHRLSGLRLEFAQPPAEDPRVSRLKSWIGLQDSPQKLFFDSLFQQSEGVLRSAFQLWLSSIDGVAGETLRIRQPLDPAFAALRNELAQEDHFTLLAIQEHGSLTYQELAEVLCESDGLSRSRMERLSALGLIESDPEHAGLRVRPEAQRFVNDVFRRANLA